MNEKQKAEALSQSLDAMSRGEESASSISADEEIRALSELGRSLGNIKFEPSPTHQATVERLLQKHRAQCERSATTGKSKPRGLTAKEINVKTSATQEPKKTATPFLPKRLIPLVALSGGVALLFVCALVVLIGGGVAWRAFRDTDMTSSPTSVSVSEASVDQDVSPSPSPTSEIVAQNPTPSPSPTSEVSPIQNPPPEPTKESTHTVFMPLVSLPEVRDAQHAALKNLRGLVQVQASNGTWTTVDTRQTIAAGQHIRTAPLSSAEILFYDGSRARMGPNTKVSVDELDAQTADGSRVVVLTQWIGETDHDVVPSDETASRYEVRTPSGTGEAKGTSFHVLVTSIQLTCFSVGEGSVAVTNLNVTVIVVAGQATTINFGQPPSEPVFRITGEGEVTQTGATWIIAGQSFETHNSTVIIGNPQVGDWVSVEGRLLPDGTRVVDRIVLLRRAPQNRFTITGRVEAITGTAWTVTGQTIAVNDGTEVESEVKVGDLVRVEGVILQGGALLAEHIHLIEEEPGWPFHFAGVVQGIADEAWTVSGVTITITGTTEIDEGILVGDVVEVQGWILDDETWLARSIERVEEEEREFEFTGYVESIDPWVVSAIAFETRDWTEIETGIDIGDRVKVKGQILADGTWVASDIERLDDEDEDEDEALYVVFVGRVNSKDPWVVSGIPLVVDDETVIKGDISIGDLVKVKVQILPDGTWLARKIRRIKVGPGLGCFSFSAVVIGINANQLVLLNGETIDLGDGVIVEGEVEVDSVILVFVCVDAEGTITIVSIIVIYQPEVVIVLPPPPPPPPPPTPQPPPCGQCRGGVTSLTLRYVGSMAGAHIQVLQKKDEVVFDGTVQPGETFSFTGSGKDGKIGTEITIKVNGQVNAKLHTSCSKPIGPGLVVGDLKVVAGRSKEGGPLCPVSEPGAPCGKCRGGVTSLTLRYVGSMAGAHIQVLQKKDEVVFDGTVQPGETFSFTGSGKDGKIGTEITIKVNGQVNTKLHTSCSKPIGPGLVAGDLKVVAGRSKEGGLLCPVSG